MQLKKMPGLALGPFVVRLRCGSHARSICSRGLVTGPVEDRRISELRVCRLGDRPSKMFVIKHHMISVGGAT